MLQEKINKMTEIKISQQGRGEVLLNMNNITQKKKKTTVWLSFQFYLIFHFIFKGPSPQTNHLIILTCKNTITDPSFINEFILNFFFKLVIKMNAILTSCNICAIFNHDKIFYVNFISDHFLSGLLQSNYQFSSLLSSMHGSTS